MLNFAANLVEKVNFDPVNSFEPVTLVANVSWVLVANPAQKPNTLAELIATGKTPDLIKPFEVERFYTDELVSELGAAAVSH